MYQIVFPEELRADKEGFEFIASLIYKKGLDVETEVCMNFSMLHDIDANLSAALGAIFDLLINKKNKKVYFAAPKVEKVRTILSRNHFLQAFITITKIENRGNFIEFMRFKPDETDKFKQYIDDELIHKELFPTHTKLVGEKIMESIFEIYANATMHGESNMICSCGEYNENNSLHTLDMTIVDCGKTIPDNVNQYLRNKSESEKNHCECLDWAFIEGHTTKSCSGGLGLFILKDFIQQNEGKIQVVSGKGVLEFSKGETKTYELYHNFPGTIVNMKFNVDDEKVYYLKGESQENLKDLL